MCRSFAQSRVLFHVVCERVKQFPRKAQLALNCLPHERVPVAARENVERTFPLSLSLSDERARARALQAFEPSDELRAFLAAPGQPKPVYLGWGSMVPGTAEEMARFAVEAAMAAGARAIVLGGWADISAASLPPGALREYAAQRVLFCSGECFRAIGKNFLENLDKNAMLGAKKSGEDSGAAKKQRRIEKLEFLMCNSLAKYFFKSASGVTKVLKGRFTHSAFKPQLKIHN